MYIIYRLDILLFSKSAKFQIHNLPGFICLNLRHVFVCSHILHEIKKAFFFFFFGGIKTYLLQIILHGSHQNS